MHSEEKNKISRRKFVQQFSTSVSTIGVLTTLPVNFPAIIRNYGKPDSKFKGVQIGAITYSFRSLPCDAESVRKYCVESNVSAIELMGNTAEAFAGAPYTYIDQEKVKERNKLPKEEKQAQDSEIATWRSKVDMKPFEKLRKMYKEKGISIYAYKPSALGTGNSDDEVHYACRAAQALGASHVTLEMPKDNGQTKRLSSIAEKYKIMVAYHGHEQQTPTFWDAALAESGYNALNCDIGHYVAAGYNPLELVAARHNRIASMHIKDRQNPANGKRNLPWGEGDTPLAQLLQTMSRNKYRFPATVELEYQVPENSDAVKEVAKCVEFCRKALEK